MTQLLLEKLDEVMPFQGVVLSDLQPKQHIDGSEPQRQPNQRCWRCLDRCRPGVRLAFAIWINLQSSRHFLGATLFFRIDKGALS